MQTIGIDISRYQKGMKLSQAVSEGIQFVLLRSGGADGPGLYKDSTFEGFYKDAVEIGLPVGCYFFANCTNEAQAIVEAKYFLSIIAGKTFPVKCWYDIEGNMQKLPKATLNAIAKAFCKTVSEAGYECGVYANASTMKLIDYNGSISATYPKWVASWGTVKPSSVKEGRDVWQFCGKAPTIRNNTIAGYAVDMDYCYFDLAAVPTPAPTPVDPVAAPTLVKGSTGAEVAKLQQNLNSLGFKLNVDGKFGQNTADAVYIFQKIAKINADYKYGPQTAGKLAEYIL